MQQILYVFNLHTQKIKKLNIFQCMYLRFILLVKADSLRNVVCYQYSHHQPIDSDDTSHDHGDNRLHDELWPHHRHGSNACATLRCPICCS